MKHALGTALMCIVSAIGAQGQVKAHFIDVGQADSILLETRTAAILIDAGGESTGDNRDREHLIDYLKTFFVRRSDLRNTLHAIIVSHPHLDHTKSLMEVFRQFKVKAFYDGGDMRGSGFPQLRAARKLPASQRGKYLAVLDKNIGRAGLSPPTLRQLRTSSGVDIRFLAGARGCENGNNNSLVVRVEYKDTAFLFTGDSELDGDGDCDDGQVEHLLERFANTNLLDVDVYKVGHHGSFNATDEDFVRAMSPTIAVISAGKEATRSPSKFHAFFFGHPRESTVAALEAGTARVREEVDAYSFQKAKKMIRNRHLRKAIYCTCWDGDVVVSINEDGDQLRVTRSP